MLDFVLLVLSVCSVGVLVLYFVICDIEAQVFPRCGFVDDDINVEDVSFTSFYDLVIENTREFSHEMNR